MLMCVQLTRLARTRCSRACRGGRVLPHRRRRPRRRRRRTAASAARSWASSSCSTCRRCCRSRRRTGSSCSASDTSATTWSPSCSRRRARCRSTWPRSARTSSTCSSSCAPRTRTRPPRAARNSPSPHTGAPLPLPVLRASRTDPRFEYGSPHFRHLYSYSYSYVCRVNVIRSEDVPPFGPPIPPDGFGPFAPSATASPVELAFAEWMVCKCVNAENAVRASKKFVELSTRTRFEYLKGDSFANLPTLYRIYTTVQYVYSYFFLTSTAFFDRPSMFGVLESLYSIRYH